MSKEKNCITKSFCIKVLVKIIFTFLSTEIHDKIKIAISIFSTFVEMFYDLKV